jgi:aspartate kinase
VCDRLLAVYGKLRAVGAITSAEDEQTELIEEAKTLIQDICNDHVFAAEAIVEDPKLKVSLAEQIKAECQELIEYIHAARRFNLEINSRSKDRVISFGEKLSCLFMTALLKDVVCQPLSSIVCLPSRY